LHYFTETRKRAFQHITASVHTELIDSKVGFCNTYSGEVCMCNKMHAFASRHVVYLQCYLLV